MDLGGISLNSTSRYLSLRQDGEVSLSANTSSIISHGLGTIPLVRIFYQNAGRWYSAKVLRSDRTQRQPWADYSVTSTTLTVSNKVDSGTGTIPIYYRIYTIDSQLTITDKVRIDKVYRTGSHTGTVAGTALSIEPNQSTTTIAHGQPEAPLWTLQFSLNQTDWYPEGTRIVGSFDTASGPPGGPYARYYYVTAFGSSDGTNFYITRQSNYSTTRTIYVRYALDYRT